MVGVERDRSLSEQTGSICADFLQWRPTNHHLQSKTIVVTNPPYSLGVRYGSHGERLTVNKPGPDTFIKHSFGFCDTVAALIPITYGTPRKRFQLESDTGSRLVMARNIGKVYFRKPDGTCATPRVGWFVFSKTLGGNFKDELLSIPLDDQTNDFECLRPSQYKQANIVVNRWGSVGRIESNASFPTEKHILKNYRTCTTKLWVKVNKGKMRNFKKTCTWLRKNWPQLSVGNNGQINDVDLIIIHNYLNKNQN